MSLPNCAGYLFPVDYRILRAYVKNCSAKISLFPIPANRFFNIFSLASAGGEIYLE